MCAQTVQPDPRPVDPQTGKPIGPLPQPGYYSGFRTLSQQKFWDATTRKLILDRVNNVPPIRFFSPEQVRILKAVCDRVLPQDDRDDAHKIPIVPQIDLRLYENSHDGYRYESMPSDREAYQLGLQAIDEMAHHDHGRAFVELGHHEQEVILRSIHDASPTAAHHIWERMSIHQFWMLLVSDCADAYYSHPWAWDEIGFGGPAYPRAYMRLERGEAEPWEEEERRYEWSPPESSVSGEYTPVAGQEEHLESPSQGGTH